MKLYLAHPFVSRQYIREMELGIESMINVDLFNPFYDIKRDDVAQVDAEKAKRYEVSTPEDVVTKDLAHMSQCDGLLGIIDGGFSIGTIMEIVYANIYMRPVLLLVTSGCEKHYWLRYHADKIFTSTDDLKQYLRWEFGDKVRDDKAREGESPAGEQATQAPGSAQPPLLRRDREEREEEHQADEYQKKEE